MTNMTRHSPGGNGIFFVNEGFVNLVRWENHPSFKGDPIAATEASQVTTEPGNPIFWAGGGDVYSTTFYIFLHFARDIMICCIMQQRSEKKICHKA